MSRISEYRCGIKINEHLCRKCGTCYRVCPSDIFSYDVETRELKIVYPEECMYCGACIYDCPVEGVISYDIPMASL